jgi:hypothetical protein
LRLSKKKKGGEKMKIEELSSLFPAVKTGKSG